MSGVNEILIVAAIVLGIFFVPRMLPKQQQRLVAISRIPLSGKMRLALATSAIYPLAAAAYFQPWKKDMIVFLYLGLGPVALAWLLAWVYSGLKNGNR